MKESLQSSGKLISSFPAPGGSSTSNPVNDDVMSSAPIVTMPGNDGRSREVDQGTQLSELSNISNDRTIQWVEKCQGCSSLDGVVGRIIRGLGKLQTEFMILAGSSRDEIIHLV